MFPPIYRLHWIDTGYVAMGRTLIYILIALFLLTMSFSCDKRKDKVPLVEEQPDISSVDELTPELFIRITILYRRENRKWVEKSQSLSSQEQERYLEEVNNAFFAQFGFSEEEFLAYGENNANDLDTYVQDHPELMREMLEEE